jgi:Sensors of blue-light using FAD
MNKLVQMVYISRANMPVTSLNGEIGPEISKILRKSRTNNRAKNIVGALYFGNGYFFQCLEGEESELMSLYEKLKQDNRHKDLKIVSLKPVSDRSFAAWEMKYLPAEQEVQKLLRSFGMSSFDPYQFDEQQTEKMLSLLMSGADLVINDLPDAECACTAWKLTALILAMLFCAEIAWRFLHG